MKDIKGFEGLYAITSCGRVWSYKSKKFLTPARDRKGYLRVCLYKEGKGNVKGIHRLVAETYIPNPENLETVDHIDSNKEHNYIGNLQWMTNEDNDRKGHCKKVRCVELNKIFESQTAAAKELNICRTNIVLCLKGKRKTCGGYHFEYVG